jgi:hypothetical protein
MWAFLPFGGGEWHPVDPHPQHRFVTPDGLTVRLKWVGPEVGPFSLDQTLLCVSTDPDVNPPQPPNPFDFTIPEG